MNIELLISSCVFFYAVAVLTTFIRIKDEKNLQRIDKTFRFLEGLLYSLTTLLLILGIRIWFQS